MPATIGLPYRPNPKVDDSQTDYSPRRGRPILFQVTAPGSLTPLFPFMLALHTNPGSLEERMAKTDRHRGK